ncbi:helix-turn-helix transcriptional regulator [Streptomyces sp. CC210A]|uniref:helix-turn-helix domain-containing protein n=1 Tax=Streptomyces sp. CC210A TaxID=2898184 RepID=UPI001F40B9D9|nr:helix-turn-helix transcriptional regulator [Streptomyces sp. CC210A]
MGNMLSPDHCRWCGEQCPHQRTGRPAEYCSTRCRQAAYRDRHKNHHAPDLKEFDRFLHAELMAASSDIRHLARALDGEATTAQDPLQGLLMLRQRIEGMVAPMVGRTRRLGSTWEQLSVLLGMTKDTARKRFAQPVVQRALSRPKPRSVTGGSGSERVPPGRGMSRDGRPAPDTGSASLPGDGIAVALSKMQRASGWSLRALGDRVGLSPSFLCRVMTGERFPTWETTCAITRACGADPEVLRRVWEDADAQRHTDPPPTGLDAALRYLHTRAGKPTPWAIAVTSGHALTPQEVSGLLDGTHLTDWDQVHRLVLILDGVPEYFEPLWKEANARQPHLTPQHPTAGLCRSSWPPAPAHRLEDLLIAFSPTLTSTDPRFRAIGRVAKATSLRTGTPWPAPGRASVGPHPARPAAAPAPPTCDTGTELPPSGPRHHDVHPVLPT